VLQVQPLFYLLTMAMTNSFIGQQICLDFNLTQKQSHELWFLRSRYVGVLLYIPNLYLRPYNTVRYESSTHNQTNAIAQSVSLV